ncbi:MAG: DUF4886 domain-containing protein [Capsulimonadaceae bacterium]|nr:DUF4886 domain-containing protein [Capsulimonadaceae bacterium]
MLHRSRPAPLLAMLLAIFCAVIASSTASAADESPKTIRLLTIGNSFADNAAHYMSDVAAAAGYKLVLYRANIGGCSMERHWKHVQAHEANPADPAGVPFTNPQTGKKEFGLKEALQSAPWDYVTIQQYSALSDKIDTYRPYASELCDYIKKYAPTAEVLVYETWAYRSDDPKFKSGNSAEDMYRIISTNYRTIASELHLRVIPVGDAFHLASITPGYQFTPDALFDFKAAVPPALPDQTHSLNVGWTWRKDPKTNGEKLQFDGHHANQAGEYLASLVFVERLTGVSSIGNTFVPAGLPAEDATLLQQFAHKAVQGILAEQK